MGTSIGAAIDYIVAGIAAPLTAVDSTAVVVDGIPATISQSMVVIGKAGPEASEAASGGQLAVVLGMNRESEDYQIPCFVYVSRPGPLAKSARDAAIALFDVVAHFVANDRTFGGTLLNGRSAEIQNLDLTQDVGEGAQRIAWFTFSIHCKNHYTP